MILRTLIVGGSMDHHHKFETLVQRHVPQLEIVGATSSVEETASWTKALKPDLIVLYVDIPLPQLLFILEFLSLLKIEILFIVAGTPKLIQTLQLIKAEYLIDPIQVHKLKESIDRISQKRYQGALVSGASQVQKVGKEHLFSKIAIANNNGFFFAEKHQIIACKASRNYTFFFLEDQRKLLASKPLKYFEMLLEKEYYFFRVNRSYIINLHYLDGYIRSKRGEIILTNGMRLRLSENRKDTFMKRIDLMAG